MKQPSGMKSKKTPLSNPCEPVRQMTSEETSGRDDINTLSPSLSIEKLAKNHPGSLQKLHETASKVAKLIEDLSPFIQEHTDAVCPSCQSICCINRHLCYSADDMICIHALGEKVPLYKKDAAGDSPCQFLGRSGCTLKRSLRPYRCNWFFCNPLLEQIQAGPVSRYRQFIHSLEEITRTRRQLIEAFANLRYEIPESLHQPQSIHPLVQPPPVL